MENAFKMEFFNSAKFFNNAKNQLEFTKETRFARYQSKFSLIFGIKKKFCFVEKIFHFLSVVHTTNTHYWFFVCVKVEFSTFHEIFFDVSIATIGM